MNYEAWRISFQDSEQAAKAAFEESQRWERLFAMAIGSVVELTEAAGIRKEDQLMGGTTQALNAIEKLKERRDKWKERALKAEQWNREMVAKAADNNLEGYRELGRRTAAAEEERDAYRIAEHRQIVLRRKMEEERDALAAHVDRLSCVIRDQVEDDDWFHKLHKVMDDAPTTSLARRDALSQSEGMKKAALFIEHKANSYDEEYGKTDPSTGHREYPGDGAEHYNELMELADELSRQAGGYAQ